MLIQYNYMLLTKLHKILAFSKYHNWLKSNKNSSSPTWLCMFNAYTCSISARGYGHHTDLNACRLASKLLQQNPDTNYRYIIHFSQVCIPSKIGRKIMRTFSQKSNILTKKKECMHITTSKYQTVENSKYCLKKDGKMKNMLKKTCLSLVIIQGKAL